MFCAGLLVPAWRLYMLPYILQRGWRFGNIAGPEEVADIMHQMIKGEEGEEEANPKALQVLKDLHQTVVYGEKAKECERCGNLFMEDANYCRKCGVKRPDLVDHPEIVPEPWFSKRASKLVGLGQAGYVPPKLPASTSPVRPAFAPSTSPGLSSAGMLQEVADLRAALAKAEQERDIAQNMVS